MVMGMFIVRKTPTGFNFRLIAANKVEIAVAAGVYSTKANCKNACLSVGKFAEKCISDGKIEDLTLKTVEEKTCPKFQIYNDKAGLFRYRLIASNGEKICISEEGYKSKSGCLNGIKSVATNAKDAEIVDETVE